MGFVKQNLVSVIAVALAVIGIPLLVYFSAGWNTEIRASLEEGVQDATRKLNNSNVDYTIAGFDAEGSSWSRSMPPSQERNRIMEEELQSLQRLSTELEREILERNRAGKTLLIDDDPRYGDLFPAPRDESARVALLTRMEEAYPEAHAAMLARAEAGDRQPSEVVETQLEARRTRERSQIVANRVDQELSEEERQRVRERLGAFREEMYWRHANSVRFFAGPDVFQGIDPSGDPNGGEDGILTLEQAWEWQHRTWIHEDLIAALVLANTSSSGDRLSPITGPIKRVLSIAVEDLPTTRTGALPSPGGGGGGGGGGGSLAQPIPYDYSAHHTGMAAWPARPNPLYDLRYATIRLIADGDRLAEIVDAFGAVNLMHVVDLDLREFDPSVDLRQGYDYGPGQTVVLTLRVETLWLRPWMKTDMPLSVRQRLGIPDDPQEPAA